MEELTKPQPSPELDSVLRRVAELEKQLSLLRHSAVAVKRQRRELTLPYDAVVFTLRDYKFAVPIAAVVEVTQMVFVAPLAAAPSSIRGVVNRRGKIVPVVDLEGSVAGSSAPLDDRQLLVFLERGSAMYAVPATSILGVHTFQTGDLDTTLDAATMPDFVAALLRQGFDPVTLLDPSLLFEAAQLDRMAGALAGLAGAEGEEHA
jgi:chemotaxis signal transduction protein